VDGNEVRASSSNGEEAEIPWDLNMYRFWIRKGVVTRVVVKTVCCLMRTGVMTIVKLNAPASEIRKLQPLFSPRPGQALWQRER